MLTDDRISVTLNKGQRMTLAYSGVMSLFAHLVAHILSKHLRDNQNLLAYDRCLLNTGTFQCLCLFRELNKCLFNTGCMLNRCGY